MDQSKRPEVMRLVPQTVFSSDSGLAAGWTLDCHRGHASNARVRSINSTAVITASESATWGWDGGRQQAGLTSPVEIFGCQASYLAATGSASVLTRALEGGRARRVFPSGSTWMGTPGKQ